VSQRVILALPEQPNGYFLALTMDLREFFEGRGYRVSIRYGRPITDEDITPIDGVELPAVLCEISGLAPATAEPATKDG
jgi:hypothetical protein